ncbi:hypothetical protein ACFQH5_17980 [Halomonas salifodinae]|uniref:Uncharacterized protein n=1 Tax=Halomonas salifodinae TaxID=438745 RepID=A0ABW2F2Y1_9GAMM
MPDPMKFDIAPIAMELIPAAVQAGSIVVFLVLTAKDSFQAFAAVILSLIWLTVSKNKMAEDFGEFRVRRHLFSLIGEWMNRNDAAEEFDDALSRYLMIDGSVENDEYKAVVTAAGLANNFRGLVSLLIYVYLVYLVATALLGR